MFTDAMTNLFTPDINRAVAFYRDLVGFTQTFQYPAMGQPEHAEFRLGHFMLVNPADQDDARSETVADPGGRANSHKRSWRRGRSTQGADFHLRASRGSGVGPAAH